VPAAGSMTIASGTATGDIKWKMTTSGTTTATRPLSL
jgi:hypothetical protein